MFDILEDFHSQPCWVRGATYGFLSAFSLPLGAAFGIMLHPVDVRSTALIVAFGAGALLFAVATELYAEALRQVEEDGSSTAIKEIVVSMVCAVVGAVMFTEMNMMLGGEEETGDHKHHKTTRKRLQASDEGTGLLHHGEADLATPEPTQRGSARSGKSGGEKSGKSDDGGGNVALSMWLGVAMDGVPESMLIGFITNEKAMTVAFLVSIFIANFPEAFASASMLHAKGMSTKAILAMWGSLCIFTSFLAGMASFLLPTDIHASENAESIHLFGSAIEGLAGGAMLAMVCATMLPEAFKVGGQWSGLVAVLGFLSSCSVKVAFGRAPGGNDHAHKAAISADELDLGTGLAHDAADQVGHGAVEALSFLAYHIRGH